MIFYFVQSLREHSGQETPPRSPVNSLGLKEAKRKASEHLRVALVLVTH